ncbi:Fatty acid oxidation complex subunit alpha [Serratia odorifera]|uniref:Fatty acid oxidation complex subunit alpha n=1 Tax=Serratia odorifera TaxID=618 RepID=A0A3S4FKJ7_SEROD|nr:Fatty acid oxidation complex subunit alpha [Serratia odorifera]
MKLLDHPTCRLFTEAGNLSQISAYYEEGRNIMWMLLRAEPRPCFNQALIEDIMALAQAAKESSLQFDFWVTGSLVPNMFNVGGDLNFFAESIKTRNRAAMTAYARACIDCVHAAARGFDTGAVSIAMVEGSALGGGFEAALAHHFLLAQNNARMGFPEIAFNLFPGMGGYSLVARKAGMRLAGGAYLEWRRTHRGMVRKPRTGRSAVPAGGGVSGNAHLYRHHPSQAERHARHAASAAASAATDPFRADGYHRRLGTCGVHH